MIQLRGDALVWTGQFQVEVFNAETITLPVGPRCQVPDGTMDLVLRGVRVNPRAVGAVASPRVRLPRLGTVASIVSGVGRLIFTIGYLGISLVLASSLTLLIAAIVAVWWALRRWRIWRESPETV